MYCGGTRCCPAGSKCTRTGSCIPSTAEDCGDGRHCKDGKVCWTSPSDYRGYKRNELYCVDADERTKLNQEIAKAKLDARDKAKQAASVREVNRTKLDTTNVKNPNNCVLYLRDDLKIKLPTGIEFFDAKRNLINVTGRPQPGDVAIIKLKGDLAKYGHVAVVRDVSSNSLTIEDAAWNPHTVMSRKVEGPTFGSVEEKLAIVGYYRPSR